MRQNYFFEYVPNAYINLCVDKAQQMANSQPSSMQQASQPQMSTCTSLESASQPTTEAAISSTKTFIMFR